MKPTWTCDGVELVTIYALLDPISRAVRYVGKTIKNPKRRLIEHLNVAKRKRRLWLHRWLASLPSKPVMVVLEVVRSDSDWQSRERRWIRRMREHGCKICNLTEGGEGLAGLKFTTEHKARISAALTTGRKFCCEQCGAEFFRRASEVAKGDCRFCSRECYSVWRTGRPHPIPEETMRRGVLAAAEMRRAMTHCKRGHALSGDNVYIGSNGSRVCKECRKIHKQRYRLAGGVG